MPKSSVTLTRVTYKITAKNRRNREKLNIQLKPSNNDGHHRLRVKTIHAWNMSKDKSHNHAGKHFMKSHIDTLEFKSSPCWVVLSSLKNFIPKKGIITKETKAPPNRTSTVKIKSETIFYLFLIIVYNY